jgi:adenine-specific DNA-methyltransferase
MQITRHELDGHAEFSGDSAFILKAAPFGLDVDLGLYELPRRNEDAHIYRATHPLAEAVIARAKDRELPPAHVRFSLSEHQGRISALEPFKGQSGNLAVSLLSVDALDQTEEHLILAAECDNGDVLDEEMVKRLLALPANVADQMPLAPEGNLDAVTENRRGEIAQEIGKRNLTFFEAETEKLEAWADDLKAGLEREIKELDRQLREAKKTSKAALTLEEKLSSQKLIKALESQRIQKRRTLFDAHDQIDAQREALINAIESKLSQHTTLHSLFTVRWTLA